MVEYLHIGFVLLATMIVVAVAANRLRLPHSILLVIAGVALALLPGLPRVELAPELVLLLVLPPLIYSAGVAMSWREFRFNLRPIGLLAIGCVAFTTVAVAASLHFLLGWAWAAGFVLGAIIAPPDVVAPLAIARRLGLVRRVLVVLEGEGLANDGTALVLYRFAVMAVTTGIFSIEKATAVFSAIVVGEIGYGIAVGWVMLRLRQAVADPHIEILLSLLTPYVAYWLPQELGGSGVLATIAAGLYVSWNGPRLISSATRLQGIFFWDLVLYILEGFVFLLTGLQARTILERASGVVTFDILWASALTVAVIVIARFAWVFPATYLPRWLIPSVARRDPSPKWQLPFMIAFTGIRGVVSLAAALALPLTTSAGAPFPQRDMILVITFAVIVVTLVGQGLLLPLVIQWLGLGRRAAAERDDERAHELAGRSAAVHAALDRLEKLREERDIPDDLFDDLRAHQQVRLRDLERIQAGLDVSQTADEVRLDLIEAERKSIHDALRDGQIIDETRRRIERDLDLREAMLASTMRIEGVGV